MKLTIEKIRTYNSVIEFIILVLLCAFLLVGGVLFVIRLFPKPAEPGIITVPDTAKTEIIRTTKYVAQLRDNYVFALESDAIAESDLSPKQKSLASYDRAGGTREIVNYHFVSAATKKETPLLEHDALIVASRFINDSKEAGPLLGKNVYAIVSADSDADGRLSVDDDVDLYVSSYDGTRLEKIGQDAYGYQLIADDTILFTEETDEGKTFRIYNDKTGKTETIKTVSEKPGNKEFDRIFY
jgi:hypothetical protein